MKNKKNITYFIGGILLVSLVVLVIQSQYLKTTQAAAKTNLGTFSNPEVAYQECKLILSEVSKALNTSDTTN
ncbi:hypothetical protein [Myroides sp. DW712]|uniref:hypothetical protein n=1 Tax=Myroides sp. DW712 TaxID=3389800 RepID=UPI00397CB569